MIYLASPYSHRSPTLRQWRYERVVEEAALLMMEGGEPVFSPIAHSHPMTVFGLGVTWGVWQEMDRAILGVCRALYVLQLPGWDESHGIAAEIAEAQRLGLPVEMREPFRDLWSA